MKKKLLALLMGTSVVFALTACGGGSDEASGTPDAEKLYGQKCASCHGQQLEGGVGLELTKVGSKYDQAGIEKIITDGIADKGMPAGQLTGADATAVAKWLSEKK